MGNTRNPKEPDYLITGLLRMIVRHEFSVRRQFHYLIK